MATPSFKLLSRILGKERLFLLALKPSIAQMAHSSGLFQRIFYWDPDGEGLLKGLRVLQSLRRERFSHSISFFPASHWKFSLFAYLVRARQRWGFSYTHSLMPRLLQHRSLGLDFLAHDTDQNLRLVQAFLGLESEALEVKLNLPLTLRHERQDLLISEDYYVCHPGSSPERGMQEKRLPARTFADLIRRIHREFGLKCLLIGGPEEEALRAEISLLAPVAVLKCPSRDLSETAAAISHSRFYLGNDSGLMHVAVALEKSCIAFFGPTDERRTGPYAYWRREKGLPRHLIVRRMDLPCAPCWSIRTVGQNPRCIYGDTRCLKDFVIEKAWPDIREFIAGISPTETKIPAGTQD